MHTKTMVKKTLDKFERLKTKKEVGEECFFCTDVKGEYNGVDCYNCKLAKRLSDKKKRMIQ